MGRGLQHPHTSKLAVPLAWNFSTRDQLTIIDTEGFQYTQPSSQPERHNKYRQDTKDNSHSHDCVSLRIHSHWGRARCRGHYDAIKANAKPWIATGDRWHLRTFVGVRMKIVCWEEGEPPSEYVLALHMESTVGVGSVLVVP